MTEHLRALFERDLDTLKKELLAYEDEGQMWLLQGEISNTAGNLFLHLCGNLQHFIGAVLGNSGYIRERDREFNDKNVSRADILNSIEETKAIVSKTLASLPANKLDEDYPINVFKGEPINTAKFLMHLSGHLMYHMGQINYHRRLLKS